MTALTGTPLVSFLIPAHNAQRWVAATLDAVLAQDYPNIEIVVVDDGSVDGTADVVESFAHRGVVLVRQKNAGAAAARNRALDRSRGEFVHFLDADDLVSANKVSTQMSALAKYPRHVCASAWERFAGDAPLMSAASSASPSLLTEPPMEWLLNAWAQGGGMLFPARWLIPRQLIEEAGDWDERLSLNDDGEFFTRVILRSEGVVTSESARAYYRSGIAGSLSGQKTDAAWLSGYRAVQSISSEALSFEDSPSVRRGLATLWQHYAHGAYPYARALANQALSNARSLDPILIRPKGGVAFRTASSLVGWKLARTLQRLSGRP